jgi:hypothetical protein
MKSCFNIKFFLVAVLFSLSFILFKIFFGDTNGAFVKDYLFAFSEIPFLFFLLCSFKSYYHTIKYLISFIGCFMLFHLVCNLGEINRVIPLELGTLTGGVFSIPFFIPPLQRWLKTIRKKSTCLL